MPIKCFVMEPTDLYDVYLRRYESAEPGSCQGEKWYHDDWLKIESQVKETDLLSYKPDKKTHTVGDYLDHSDPRWPKQCTCGHVFTDDANYQYFPQRLYKHGDTGELLIQREFPVGALWRATYLEDRESKYHCGIDGQSWMCKTPGGDWAIDSRARNCTMPEDTVHKCWCRHGVAPNFTVDKNGTTCAAGAGSIQCGSYHGFLQNGFLT